MSDKKLESKTKMVKVDLGRTTSKPANSLKPKETKTKK
jgi:hypothetical protein